MTSVLRWRCRSYKNDASSSDSDGKLTPLNGCLRLSCQPFFFLVQRVIRSVKPSFIYTLLAAYPTYHKLHQLCTYLHCPHSDSFVPSNDPCLFYDVLVTWRDHSVTGGCHHPAPDRWTVSPIVARKRHTRRGHLPGSRQWSTVLPSSCTFILDINVQKSAL
jgi:hypothetical protein